MIADEEENPEIQVSVEKNKVEDKTLEEMSQKEVTLSENLSSKIAQLREEIESQNEIERNFEGKMIKKEKNEKIEGLIAVPKEKGGMELILRKK